MRRPCARLAAALFVLGAPGAGALPPADTGQNVSEEISSDETRPDEPTNRFTQELLVTAADPALPTEAVHSGREIEQRSGQDLGYFLRREAGVASFRRGPIGLDPQVRGLQETQVAVLVDGTRTFAAGPARMDSDLAHVSPRAVERLRVVKGPYALTWGAGGLAAIQAETFRPPFGDGGLELGGRAGLAYGDNASTGDVYAGGWGASDALRFQVLAQARSGDDWEDGDGNAVPGDYRSGDARWSLGASLGERGFVEYVGGYQEQSDVDYPGRLLDANYFYTRSHSVELQWSPAAARLDTAFARVYANRKDHRMNNDEKPTAQPNPNRIPPFGIAVDLPTESNTAGFQLALEGNAGDLAWKAGVDGYALRQTATRTISRRDRGVVIFEDVVWPDAETDDLGAYFQLVKNRRNASLAATVRADRVEASAGEVSEFFRANTTGDLDQSETNWSAAVSGRFRLDEGWTLSAGAGRAVRTATALERYSDRFPATKFQIAAEFMGDPGIEPEESFQVDLGAEYRNGPFLFQVDAFHRSVDDYITVTPDPTLPRRLPLSPTTVYRYLNGDEARFSGGEIRVRHRATERVEWSASASYVRGEDKLFDEPVFGLPPLTGRFGLRLEPREALWVDLDWTLVEGQDRVASSRLEQPTPGYSVVDLRFTWEPARSWRWLAGVENLLDKRYVNHLNSFDPFARARIAEQGRNVHAAVEVSF